MNTKLAIDLLTQSQNNLTATLAALGLLGNGETINTLKQKLELIIKAAFVKQQQLSSKVDIIDEKIQQSNEKLDLAVSHNTTEQERLLNLKKEQGELQIAVKTLEDKKKILGSDGNGKKADIQKEIVVIKDNIKKTETEIKQIERQITDGVNLVARYGSLLDQAKTAQDNANYHNQFVQRWDIIGYEKKRKRFGKIYHEAVYGWVTNQEQVNLRDQYQNQANQLTADANSIQGKVDEFNKNKSTLQENKDSKNAELWLYIHELDAKQNLLLFVGTQSDNELALIDLQIQQVQEDLQQLQITEIPNQEKAVDGTNRRVTQGQSELDRLRSDKGSAQKDLDTFVKVNQELLTTDLSLGLLKDAIAKVQGTIASLQRDLVKPNQSVAVINGLNKSIGVEQGKLVQLKQQYQLLALGELGVNQERLESLNGQLASEVSVNGGVKLNTIEGYVVLVPQLVQQLTGLSDIWVGNLKENHRFTVEVSDLFQKDITAFESLTDYIGDNLADPYGDYVLNKVQLDEAIALQDTQVKYRDALAKAVDDLGENIALQKKSVQQSDELAGKLEHIRDLRSFEKGYGDLQTALGKLASVDKADYESSDQKVKKIAEDLLKKLDGNEQYKLVADKLRLALDNYKTFATANLQTYTNKYQGFLDLQKNQIDDVKKIQDEKDLKSQEAIRNWQAVRSDVTGNYYFLTPARDWSGAQAFAQSAGGNLVTINNQDEQNWLFQRYKSYVWIGLSDHIQEGVWRWVSGEPVTYTNWLPNQPDNWDGIEDFVQLNLTGDGRWNDLPHVGIHNGNIPGIVELNFQKYDQQIQAVNDKATADKARVAGELQSLHDQGIRILISQTAEALRPLLIDEVNEEVTNKIADLPNQIDLSNSLILKQWKSEEGGNGHYYKVIYQPNGISWNTAKAEAEALGGYLVTITSTEENNFVSSLFSGNSSAWKNLGIDTRGPWIGGFQPSNSPEPDGGWQWVSGEPFTFTNWGVSANGDKQPLDANDFGEDYIHFFGGGNNNFTAKTWNDLHADTSSYGGNPLAYIIELDSLNSTYLQKLKQQEQWIETNLQKYVEAKKIEVIQTKEQQLALIGQKVCPSSALYFDGVNDYVNVGVKPSLEFSKTFTIEAWVNPQKQIQQYGGIIVNREGEYEVIIGVDSTLILAFANSSPGWTGISTGYVVKTNEWTHIAISYDNGLIKTYANGLLIHTYDGAGSLGDAHPNEDDFRIGGRQVVDQYFKGEIDDVRVWNVARTQAEIQTNLNQKLSGKEQGLVGYWNFEETSGSTVTDLTVNNNYGSLINGVQRIVANANLISRPAGKSLYFDGVNDYINAGTNPSLEISTNLTLEAWINPQQDSRHRGIVGREGEYLLAVSGLDNTIYYAVANTNPGWTWISTGYGVKSNQWSHIAFSFESGRIKAYVNGELIYKYDGVGTIVDAPPTNLDELRIGNRQWNNVDSFKGEIDEVRVWNVTRTQAEIQAKLSQKLSGKEQGLAGYWNFEEATGNTVNDLTTNKNNGSLINGVQRAVANANPITRPKGKALYFDGVNDYINAGTNASLIFSDKFTLEAWIKPINQGGAEGGIIINKEGEYEIARFSDGTIRWALAGINWGVDWFNTGYVAPDNQWTHITLSYDKNAVKLYANGQLVHSYDASVTIGDYWTNWNEFRIGGRQASNPQYFKGEIDEVRVWNIARTQAEIQANLSQRITGKEQGLVGYWNFEETSGHIVNDLTTNSNHGMLINGVQRTVTNANLITRPEGKALYFDGVNDYINAGTNASLIVSDKFTLEAWIKPINQGGEQGGIIINKEGEYEIARFSDGTIRWALAGINWGVDWFNTGYVAPDNQWTHITLSYDKNAVKLYANGQLVHSYDASVTIGDYWTNWNEFRIGGRQAYSQYFQGEIDEVRVWNVARTQAEIQTNLSQKLSGKEQGLVGYWNFEETSGHIVNDLTANGNHGMLINGVQRTVNNANPITRPEGKALYFDGVNDYINAGTNTSLIVSDKFTLEAWIKPVNQGGAEGGIIINKEGEYEIARFSDGTIRWALAGINWGVDWFNTGYVAPDNQWTHITLSYDKNAVKLYANGQLVHSYDASVTIGDYWTNWNDFRIGGRQASNPQYFKGEIDEVRVWNIARTQAEVQANLSQRLTGKEQGLVGYWNFEESSGNTVYDLTANDNDGTLINGTQRTIDSAVSIPLVTAQQIQVTEDKAISDLQKLRLETAYLTLQAEKDPDKLQKYLQEYQFNQLTLNNIKQTTPPVQNLADNNLIGDFNNDKINDTFHHWNVSGANELYLGKSDGSFTKFINPISTTAINESPTNVFTGDFNGDNKSDLYFYWKTTGRNRLYISNGNGTFTQYFDPISTTAINGSPDYTITADFNGDGKQDTYFYWKASGTNRLYISNGNGTFTQYLDPITTTLINGSPDQVQVNDFNNDGKIDIRFQWTTSNTIRTFLNKGNSIFSQALSPKEIRDQYYPDLNQADTLYKLQTQIDKEIGESEKQIEELKASITQKQADSAASTSQATWYEEQAATHWELSRKAGPTWTEQREEKGRSGRSETVTITHVDHHWIIWDTYTQQAASLRQHSAKLLQGIENDTIIQNTANDILKQWQAANSVADETALTQAQLTTLLNQLEANRQLTADKNKQIADWEKLLPTLQSQLQQAIKDAETAKNTVTQEWTEYQTSQQDYQTALGEVLTRRAQLQTQGQILLQEINAVNQWVSQQNSLLADEISQVETLITQLTTQRDAIAPTPLDKAGDENLTKKALLDQSIQLLTQKQTVLTSQQSTFIQKQTLLETQKKVIQTQYQLLDAYLDSPDNDTSSLENLLTDTRATLLEVQKLAEQAEASSNALTALMDDVQTSLLLQNDKYLSAIKDKQQTLQDLLKAAELKENDTLKATQKQLELNNLETQLIPILQKAKDAGSQEATKLLEVAAHNNFATVAELYYRDYKDLASDQGGGCAKGIARPEDLQLANYYYGEMLKYRQLKAEAEAQAAQFTQIRNLADSQIAAIQQQQTLAAQELAQLNKSIGNSQEQIEAKQEELAIAQFRIDALAQIRNWTEKTVAQLLSVETLNLAQAQLEQNIAQNRQYLIDNTVKATLDKQRLDIERDRQIAVTKLEQLNQINTEKALQTAINNLRSDLGVNPLEDIIQQAEYKGQLAGILADLDTLKQQQPNLPESLKTLLTATTQDIHSALQGKEAKTIQENLLNTATALIEQSNKLNAEVTKLDQEEQKYIGLLKQSETDLKGATKALYEEIQRSGVLEKEKQLINAQNLEILYRIGYAQGAVDLSSQLAKESQQILSQIIEGRIAERKVRKKAFVNELLGTATLIIAVAATAITAGAALSAYAGVIAAGGTTAAASTAATAAIAANASIVTTLQTVGASLSAVQSAYNGDWKGAIFNAGMAALGAAELGGFQLPDIGLTNAVKDLGYQSFEGFQNFGQVRQFASGIYNGYQAIESGNTLAGFTSIVQAALVPFKESSYSYLYKAGSSIYSGVQLAKEDNWLGATSSFLNAAFTLSSNLSKTLGEHFSVSKDVLDIISKLELGVNAASAIKTVINNDNLEGWLSGIQQVSDGFINYVNENTPPPPPQTPIDLEQSLNIEDAIDKVNQDFQKLKESANGDKIKIDTLSQIESQIVTSLEKNKGALKQADFEAFRINFLSNTDVNIKQFSETLNFFKAKGIEAFHNAENDDLKKYYSEEYPNYKQLPGHQKAVAIMSIMTGIDPKDLSDYLPGLGITGVKGFNWYSGFSDKLLLGTALHDVTDFLDDALKNQGIDSWNKSVWGISNSTVSALKMFSDAVGKEVSDVVKETVQSALKPINYTTKLLDPLIVDLNNDGLQLISLENSSTRFDIDGDGYAENTAWVSPQDGILTLDLNHDGTINNITEIFSERYNNGTAKSGLEALATLDSNKNGIISAADDQFNQILVWQDLNQDGISQANELKTLTQHGITSITLNGITTETLQDGNIIRTRSIFNRNDGTLGQIADVAFLVTQTGFKTIQTPNGIQIIAENNSASSLSIFNDNLNHTLNLADAKVQVAIGSTGNDNFYTTASEGVFLSGAEGNDILTGGSGNDWIIGDTGADQLFGKAGNDILYIDAQDTKIDGGEGQDIAIVTTSQSVTLDLALSNLETALGNDGNDTFTNSGAVNVVIDGGKGNDTIKGGAGDDVLNGGEGDDKLYGADGNDQLYGNEGNDELHGWKGSDTLYGGSGNDILYGQQDNDFLYGEDGNDQLQGNEGNDEIQAGNGSDTLYGGSGDDKLYGNAGNDKLYGEDGNDQLYGNEGNDELHGWDGADTMYGGADNDTLYGHQGNDSLFGDAGDDKLYGDPGDDVIQGGEGIDWLYGNVGNDTLKGNEGNDFLYGEDGNDYLYGNEGNDELYGNLGNDVLEGSDGDDKLFGEEGTDSLNGGTGNDTLDGGAGIDTLVGGLGNDIYQIDSTTDIITELANQGTDTIQSSITFNLAALPNIENLTLTGSSAINGTGNTLNNTLTGNGANNTLNGGEGNDILNGSAGIDTLVGGLGNDTYQVDSTTDTITELANQGTDTIQSSITFSLTNLANIENLTLTGSDNLNATGNTANNILTGNSGINILNGGAGIDTLIGGLGNDIYQVDSTTDTITELADQGIDTIQSSVTFSLAVLPNIENLTLTGSSPINGTGNTLNNTLIGNSANNTLNGGEGNDILNGGAGIDALLGGLGNDIYQIDTNTDTITENIGEGTDTIQSTVNYSLATLANIENLTLTGSAAINGTGNTLNNTLIGNSANNTLNGGDGNDVLNGGAGIDTLVGGLGNDIYQIDTSTDTITENIGEGTDTVQSTLNSSLAALANIENLTLTGSAAISGTGNTGNNTLTGNSANNTLNGGDGNDVLNGGAGIDTLVGGLGNDIYQVDTSTDTITENIGEGTDTVQSTLNYSLAALANIENLTLTGSVAVIGTGNTGNNTLTGNSANNTLNGDEGNDILNGGTGIDALVGGLGNDTYQVDSTTDTITELANQGTDTIQSSVTYSLVALTQVENLILTSSSAINGTGNTANNTIIGNNTNNTIIGKAGKDTLTGGGGSDRFDYKTLTDSLLANPDVITDFNANPSNDLLLVTPARSGFTNAGAIAALTATEINAKLTPTNFAANYAAQFTVGTRTFVAINDATAGFNATTDALTEVTGLTGTLNLNNFVTI